MNFLVAAPAWGERHVWFLCNVFLPAMHKCAERIDGEVRFAIATDRPEVIDRRFKTLPYGYHFGELGDVRNPYTALSICHRDAMSEAEPGEAIVLACADMVPSVEMLTAVERRFEQGKKVVACAGVRAIESEERAPLGAPGMELSQWAWDHRHPWIEECLFGEGRTAIPAYVFFRQHGSVFLHAFHLHPLAVRNGRGLSFRGTIDHDLLAAFAPEDVHVVTDPSELCIIEISPRWHDFMRHEKANRFEDIVAWARENAAPMHRRMFRHRIHIAGRRHGHSDVPAAISALLDQG
jgi:hypothetical protein